MCESKLLSTTLRGFGLLLIQGQHFLFNEQEYRRLPNQTHALSDGSVLPEPVGQAISSNVDDKTLHELYAFPFYDALLAGAASVMCSYNRANNSYACQNSKLLNGILKTEMGFEGFVVSGMDRSHTHNFVSLAYMYNRLGWTTHRCCICQRRPRRCYA